jgi:hypothetical protein
MTHTSDFSTDSIAHNADDEAIHGAWLGPAIGASILTLAWAAYLVPLLIGIFSVRL